MTGTGLEDAKNLVTRYKKGEEKRMTPDIWRAKKVVDATLHPGTLSPNTTPLCSLWERIGRANVHSQRTLEAQSGSDFGC